MEQTESEDTGSIAEGAKKRKFETTLGSLLQNVTEKPSFGSDEPTEESSNNELPPDDRMDLGGSDQAEADVEPDKMSMDIPLEIATSETNVTHDKMDVESSSNNDKMDLESSSNNDKMDLESSSNNDKMDLESSSNNDKMDLELSSNNDEMNIKCSPNDEMNIDSSLNDEMNIDASFEVKLTYNKDIINPDLENNSKNAYAKTGDYDMDTVGSSPSNLQVPSEHNMEGVESRAEISPEREIKTNEENEDPISTEDEEVSTRPRGSRQVGKEPRGGIQKRRRINRRTEEIIWQNGDSQTRTRSLRPSSVTNVNRTTPVRGNLEHVPTSEALRTDESTQSDRQKSDLEDNELELSALQEEAKIPSRDEREDEGGIEATFDGGVRNVAAEDMKHPIYPHVDNSDSVDPGFVSDTDSTNVISYSEAETMPPLDVNSVSTDQPQDDIETSPSAQTEDSRPIHGLEDESPTSSKGSNVEKQPVDINGSFTGVEASTVLMSSEKKTNDIGKEKTSQRADVPTQHDGNDGNNGNDVIETKAFDEQTVVMNQSSETITQGQNDQIDQELGIADPQSHDHMGVMSLSSRSEPQSTSQMSTQQEIPDYERTYEFTQTANVEDLIIDTDSTQDDYFVSHLAATEVLNIANGSEIELSSGSDFVNAELLQEGESKMQDRSGSILIESVLSRYDPNISVDTEQKGDQVGIHESSESHMPEAQQTITSMPNLPMPTASTSNTKKIKEFMLPKVIEEREKLQSTVGISQEEISMIENQSPRFEDTDISMEESEAYVRPIPEQGKLLSKAKRFPVRPTASKTQSKREKDRGPGNSKRVAKKVAQKAMLMSKSNPVAERQLIEAVTKNYKQFYCQELRSVLDRIAQSMNRSFSDSDRTHFVENLQESMEDVFGLSAEAETLAVQQQEVREVQTTLTTELEEIQSRFLNTAAKSPDSHLEALCQAFCTTIQEYASEFYKKIYASKIVHVVREHQIQQLSDRLHEQASMISEHEQQLTVFKHERTREEQERDLTISLGNETERLQKQYLEIYQALSTKNEENEELERQVVSLKEHCEYLKKLMENEKTVSNQTLAGLRADLERQKVINEDLIQEQERRMTDLRNEYADLGSRLKQEPQESFGQTNLIAVSEIKSLSQQNAKLMEEIQGLRSLKETYSPEVWPGLAQGKFSMDSLGDLIENLPQKLLSLLPMERERTIRPASDDLRSPSDLNKLENIIKALNKQIKEFNDSMCDRCNCKHHLRDLSRQISKLGDDLNCSQPLPATSSQVIEEIRHSQNRLFGLMKQVQNGQEKCISNGSTQRELLSKDIENALLRFEKSISNPGCSCRAPGVGLEDIRELRRNIGGNQASIDYLTRTVEHVAKEETYRSFGLLNTLEKLRLGLHIELKNIQIFQRRLRSQLSDTKSLHSEQCSIADKTTKSTQTSSSYKAIVSSSNTVHQSRETSPRNRNPPRRTQPVEQPKPRPRQRETIEDWLPSLRQRESSEERKRKYDLGPPISKRHR